MSEREELLELRKKTGMNRREFCEYFGIPYRTVQDWELGSRKMPTYLLKLMEFKINTVKLKKDKKSRRVLEKIDRKEELKEELKAELVAELKKEHLVAEAEKKEGLS